MATVAQRWDQWLDLVSSLAAHPCPTFPREQVGEQLAQSFRTQLAWTWADGDELTFTLENPIPGWPDHEVLGLWVEDMSNHPTLCFYQHTNLPVPLTVGRTPCSGADANRFVVLAERGEDFSDDDVSVARLIQPLLALLNHQVALLEGMGCPEAAGNGLTGREVVVLRLLSEGRTAVAIAHALQVSPRTVHTHLAHIYRKLGVCDRMRAVMIATELGVLDPTLQQRVHT
jgi:DNA-binding CsgD family transcriptional regulator